MDDPGGSTYLTAILCLLLSAYFSGSEAALFSSDLIKLRTRFAKDKKLNLVLALKDDAKTLLSSILLGNTMVNVMFSSVVALIVLAHFPRLGGLSDLLSTLIAAALVLIFGEVFPKFLAMKDPELTAMALSPSLQLVNRLLKPVSGVLENIASGIVKWLPAAKWQNSETLEEARLKAAVEYGENSGLIRQDEKEMIYGVIETQELEVADVMVPRPKIIALEEDKSALEMLELMLSKGFSRVPVFSDSIDNITGIVNIKDITGFVAENMSHWRDDLARLPAKAFAQPPHFVPESKKVSDLLYEMKRKGVHMAIVVDEFDGISGLCTLEDLIEEIVGDIQDEYDQERPGAVEIRPGVWQVSGSMSLVDLEEATGISIDLEECNTVAGVVMKCLDRMPVRGDSFCLLEPRVCFKVNEVKGPRIESVTIEVIENHDRELLETSLKVPVSEGM